MKLLVLLFASTVATCSGAVFDRSAALFGVIPRGGSEDKDIDDYEKAEKSIFDAVEKVEKKVLNAAEQAEKAVEHAIEDEVDTIFFQDDHVEEEEDTKKKKGKVKSDSGEGKKGGDSAIKRATAAAGKAEKAVERAIKDEVNKVFPPSGDKKTD